MWSALSRSFHLRHNAEMLAPVILWVGTVMLLQKLWTGGIFADAKSAHDPDVVRSAGAHLWRL